MTAQILDGKKTAAAIKAELKERVDALRERGVVPGPRHGARRRRPRLAVVRRGQAPRLRRGRHLVDPPRPARRHLAGRARGRGRGAQRRPRLHRLHRAAAAAAAHRHRRDPRARRPGQGCRRAAPDQPRPPGAQRQPADHHAAAVHAARRDRADAASRHRPRRASTWSSSAAASPSAARSARCSPAARSTPPSR